MRILVSLVVGALAVVGLQYPANAAKDMDCDNFGSQKAAQLFFLNNNPAADPHNLDSDGDWVVCESNPGPYYYGRDPNPGGNNTPAPVAQVPQPIKVVNVISGELIRVRQGSKPSYVVHLLGTKVPRESCKSKSAVKDLRSWVKRDMVVKVIVDKRAPNKDRDGHVWRYLTRVKGDYDIGGSQIANGYAKVERKIRFNAKSKYLRWENKAKADLEGFYGKC